MADGEDKKKHKMEEFMNTKTGPSSADSGKPPVYDMIARRLRDYYDEIAKQPVPDRFLELLDRLESKTAPKDNNS